MRTGPLLITGCALLLAGCEAATRYDTGAVVLDISNDEVFRADGATSETFLAAYSALERNDLAEAEVLLARALQEKPRDPYALLAMGTVMERTGRFYSATDHYRSAIRYGGAAEGRSIEAAKAGREDLTTVAAQARAGLSRMAR